ncbi:putative glutathione transferase [Helianthus anomalus]
MFAQDSEVNITTEPYGDGEEGWYETIVGNFRIPETAALEDLLPTGPGGHAVAMGGGKGSHAAAVGGSKASKAKRQEKLVSMVVKQASSVVTTAPLPPPLSSPRKPPCDEKKVEEPEQVVQFESSEETMPTHEAGGLFTQPLDETTVYDDILDSSNNVIDPTANWASAKGERAQTQKSSHFEFGSSFGAGGDGDFDQPPNLTQGNRIGVLIPHV